MTTTARYRSAAGGALVIATTTTAVCWGALRPLLAVSLAVGTGWSVDEYSDAHAGRDESRVCYVSRRQVIVLC